PLIGRGERKVPLLNRAVRPIDAQLSIDLPRSDARERALEGPPFRRPRAEVCSGPERVNPADLADFDVPFADCASLRRSLEDRVEVGPERAVIPEPSVAAARVVFELLVDADTGGPGPGHAHVAEAELALKHSEQGSRRGHLCVFQFLSTMRGVLDAD